MKNRFGAHYFPTSAVVKSCAAAMGVTLTTSSMLIGRDKKNDINQDEEHENYTSPHWNTSFNTSSISTLLENLQKQRNYELSLMKPPSLSLLDKSLCRCEVATTPTRKLSEIRRNLRRRQTLMRMKQQSTKDLIESRYDINWKDDPLGIGAFGTVHLATTKAHLNKNIRNPNDSKVAIKKINKQFTDQESFQREMRALLDIREFGGHPNICALREHYDLGDHYYLILDFIGGGEMFDHLMNNGAYSEADAARLVREVASALAFLHGIGVVHADLKPENVMLSTPNRGDAVVKLVDFGSAEFLRGDYDPNDMEQDEDDILLAPDESITHTPAYCPPESFVKKNGRRERPKPPHDMWALGLILYIMLTGVHPYDLSGDSPDEHVEARITKPDKYTVPLSHDSIYTSHLSDSAIDLISKLMNRDPNSRMTAYDMLNHPWVRGETATTDIIAGSDERLNKLKYKMQKKFFEDVLNWSDDDDEIRRKTSLIERSFQSFDLKKKGFLTEGDLDDSDNTEEGGPSLTMSDFSNLLSSNMKSLHFPKGHVIYNEGDIGHHMYFINSGKIEITTKDGSRATRNQGDFFGEGALLNPRNKRSATVQCKSPVHAMQIPRDYFEKMVADSPQSEMLLTLREKDKIRKRNRAKAILRLQSTLQEIKFNKGDHLFKMGEEGDYLFILEKGNVDVIIDEKKVFGVTPGNVCGEHSLLTGKPRNTRALCVSNEGCIAQKLAGRDFRKLVDVSPNVKDSLYDLNMRRQFKKAVVLRLNKEFPYANPREAFDAVDLEKRGVLDVEAISKLLRELNPEITKEEINEMMIALDLTQSGDITFEEFKKLFIANFRTASSI